MDIREFISIIEEYGYTTANVEIEEENEMRAWVIDDVEVFEVPFDYDLTAFEVYVGNDLKGTIYPETIADVLMIAADLNDGQNPLADNWEDGRGGTLSY